MFLLFALLAALGGLAAAPACSGYSCAVAGCSPNTVRLTLPPPAATTFPLGVKVCFKDDCRTAQLADPGSAGSSASFAATTPSLEAPTVDATLSPTAAGSLALVVTWSGQGNLVANGDRYTVTITDANGATVTSFDKPATYTISYPDGKDCAACKSAVVE